MLRPEKRLGFEILPIKGRMTLIPITPLSFSPLWGESMRRRGLVAFWMSLDSRLRGSDDFFCCSTIPTTLLSSYPQEI
jgi:hypothetical protein